MNNLYKEVLERARKFYDSETASPALKQMLAGIFPELAESKDERIRKSLLRMISDIDGGYPFENYGIIKKEAITYLEKQKEPEDKGEISDGYHTFNELYYYRMLYNAAFFNLLPKELVHKSKRHHDGEECFGGGWFIVMANLPTGQISNHYELKDWDLFQIPEKDTADKWDGHTPQEAAERIHKYLLETQKEQKSVEWSEEDEKNLKDLLAYGEMRLGLRHWIAGLPEKLNSRPQPQWKPSEAQKNALKEVLDMAEAYGILQKMGRTYDDIIELQNDLEEEF